MALFSYAEEETVPAPSEAHEIPEAVLNKLKNGEELTSEDTFAAFGVHKIEFPAHFGLENIHEKLKIDLENFQFEGFHLKSENLNVEPLNLKNINIDFNLDHLNLDRVNNLNLEGFNNIDLKLDDV